MLKNINPNIFKAYDIRGIYPSDLNEDMAEAVGKAFTKVIQPTQVIVGQDGRVSSPSLTKALIKGFTSMGVHVIDVGRVKPNLYYYPRPTKKIPGIGVPPSHNPKEYNGFKMVRK